MNCSEYRIVEVDDLPGEHEWMLIDEPKAVTFVVVRGHMTPAVVADGWAAYRSVMRNRGTPYWPKLSLAV